FPTVHVPQESSARQRPRQQEAFVLSLSLSSELPREVVLERELHLDPVAVETVGEVLASSPLILPADHHVRYRRVEQITEEVLPGLERVGSLAVSVVDVLARIADRSRETLVPLVIQEEARADD